MSEVVPGFPGALSRVKLGLVFGVTPQAVDKWVRNGCPRNDDGTFNAVAVFGWWKEREYRRGYDDGLESDERIEDDGEDYKGRLVRARALLAEAELAEVLQRFARTEDVEQQWARALAIFSSTLQALPAGMAPRLADMEPDEIREALDTALSDAVARMRDAYESAEIVE